MTTRRIALSLVLPVLALTAVVAGCGGGGGTGNGAAPTAQTVSGSVSVLGIWVGEEQKSFQAVIDDFRSRFPNVKVPYTRAGNNLPTVLTTAVQGGSPPDVAAPSQPGLVSSFVRQHKLKPLDFARRATLANFGRPIVDLGTVNGTFYSLVFKADNKSTVFYNVQAYNDAGVTPASDWNEFLADAQTIKASGPPAYSIPGGEGWPLTTYSRTSTCARPGQRSTTHSRGTPLRGLFATTSGTTDRSNRRSQFLDLDLSRRQQLIPVLSGGGRAGEVRLDHVDEPRLVRCDSMPVEEPLEIGEQKAALSCQLPNAAIQCFRRRRSAIVASRERPSSRRLRSLSPSLGS